MEKSLYELLTASKNNKAMNNLDITRRYSRLLIDNSVKYSINPKYFEKDSKLKKAVYSIIQSAFKDYTRNGRENFEIYLKNDYEVDRVKKVKEEIEETYCFRGTDAGFYEVPLLGEAVDFSIKNISVKVLPISLIKEYL